MGLSTCSAHRHQSLWRTEPGDRTAAAVGILRPCIPPASHTVCLEPCGYLGDGDGGINVGGVEGIPFLVYFGVYLLTVLL